MYKSVIDADPGDAEIVAAYEFSKYPRIVDVGGGHGRLLVEVLKRNPGARGILLDRPSVVATAQYTIHAAGVGNRCAALGGDMFSEVPRGADLYILANVLTDWEDATVAVLLRNCRVAMREQATLLVVERRLESTGGRTRSARQIETLLVDAGFDRTGSLEVGARVVLEARPRPSPD